MKRCGRCKRELPLTEFGSDCRKRDGVRSSCKACNAEQRKIRSLNGEGYKVGYEPLLAEIFNQLVKDYKKPPKGAFAVIRGEDWESFRVTRETVLAGVNGPDFDYYAKCVGMPIEDLRTRMLRRLHD